MQESVSMHKSPTPVRHSRMNQARSEEEEKERQKDRGQEADGKKGSPTKQKESYDQFIIANMKYKTDLENTLNTHSSLLDRLFQIDLLIRMLWIIWKGILMRQ